MTPWAPILVPVGGAVAVLLSAAIHRVNASVGNRSVGVPVTSVIALASVVATLVVSVWVANTSATAEWPWWGPLLTPGLAVVGFSRVMVVLVPAIAFPVVTYAAASMRGDAGLPRLLALLTAFTGVMEMLVSAADLLTLLVAWELVGAISWALIAYEWTETWRVRSARAAFLTTRFGDLGLYVAAAALFAGTGSLAFAAIPMLGPASLSVVAAGILLAAAAKSAQLPFSPWLFSAMAGPTPASALLHSATMVAAGAYVLVRLEPALAAAPWFGPAVAWLGLTTALAGGIVATVQLDLKKALAASTSAQYGLMFVAIGAGAPAAAGVHLVTHAAFKALLFLGAGVVLHAAKTLDLAVLRERRWGSLLPRAAALFAVGVLALAAVPPLGAAFSKDHVLAAAAVQGPWLAAGVLAAGTLSALYAFRLQVLAYAIRRPESAGNRVAPEVTSVQRPSVVELGSIGALALVSLVLGLLWFPGGTRLAEAVVDGRLPAAQAWALPTSLATIVIAVVITWRLHARGLFATFAIAESPRSRIADWFALPTLAQRGVAAPTLRLAHLLARVDDRVIDAGIRAAAHVGTLLSGVLAWWADRDVDAAVTGLARFTRWTAEVSGATDDRALDHAVEQMAREVGVAGAWTRRLQTGFTHQYYTTLALGTLVILVIAVASHLAAGGTFVRLWSTVTGG